MRCMQRTHPAIMTKPTTNQQQHPNKRTQSVNAELRAADAEAEQLLRQLQRAAADAARGAGRLRDLQALLGRHQEEQQALAAGGEAAAAAELSRMARRAQLLAAASGGDGDGGDGSGGAGGSGGAAWRLRPFEPQQDKAAGQAAAAEQQQEEEQRDEVAARDVGQGAAAVAAV